MWSYYGCKNKLAKHYPVPLANKIIEPFAGAAFYSVKHGLGREVLLVDRYKVICDIWHFLINATREQIENLPNPKTGDKVRDLKIPEVQQQLVYFMTSRANALPLNTVGQWSSFKTIQKRILDSLDGIRNWKVDNKSYEDIPNQEATWFIDPPYEFGGHRYKFSNKMIDFKKLSKWCYDRKGQIIVCENTKATWMPFSPLIKLKGQKHTTMEASFSLVQGVGFSNMQHLKDLPAGTL